MFFVYIIRNPSGVYYKGFTENPAVRLEFHNSGLSRYTKGKGPWEYVFIRSFSSKSEALKYEKMLKRQNHKYLDWLIKQPVNELAKWNAGGRLG